jgi:hypothetical protein
MPQSERTGIAFYVTLKCFAQLARRRPVTAQQAAVSKSRQTVVLDWQQRICFQINSGIPFTWTATGTSNWNTFAAGRSRSSDLLLQNWGFLTRAESRICSESALEILQLSTLIVWEHRVSQSDTSSCRLQAVRYADGCCVSTSNLFCS